jgi:hypothetical protein
MPTGTYPPEPDLKSGFQHRLTSSTLPYIIVTKLVEDVPKGALGTLALVSRQLRESSQKALFGHVRFRLYNLRRKGQSHRAFRFISTLQHSQAIKLQTFVQSIWFDNDSSYISLLELLQALAVVLPSLVKLKSMSFTTWHWGSSLMVADIFDSIAYRLPKGFERLMCVSTTNLQMIMIFAARRSGDDTRE